MSIGRLSFLLPPLGYLATGMALRAASRPDVWVAPSVYKPGKSLLQIFLTFDLGAGHFGAYIADLFVLNFSWIMTLVIAGWLCTIVIAIVRQRNQNLNLALQSYRTLFVVLVTPMQRWRVRRRTATLRCTRRAGNLVASKKLTFTQTSIFAIPTPT